MDNRLRRMVFFLWILGFSLALSQDAFPTTLPDSTKEILKKLKLDPSILANIDKELQLPRGWIAKAKKEGELRIISTSSAADPREIKAFYAPFKERYPFIAIKQSGASRQTRAIKTLLAYKRGKISAEIVTNLANAFHSFKEADALEDLRNIPTVAALPEIAKDPDGLWVGTNHNYWCMVYNVRLVKREDLPKKWEDLLSNPIWRNGNLALGNRPGRWALQLWGTKGEKWTKDFLSRLFNEVGPQRRKEGVSALIELTAAGEFHGGIPAPSGLAYQKVLNGAPIGFSCPEPLPVQPSEIVILKGAPNIHAARVFINWLLSTEGQISQYFARAVPPVHKDLLRVELMPFGEEIIGKKLMYQNRSWEIEILPKLSEFWNDLWLGKGRRR